MCRGFPPGDLPGTLRRPGVLQLRRAFCGWLWVIHKRMTNTPIPAMFMPKTSGFYRYKQAEAEMRAVAECQRSRYRLGKDDFEGTA